MKTLGKKLKECEKIIQDKKLILLELYYNHVFSRR